MSYACAGKRLFFPELSVLYLKPLDSLLWQVLYSTGAAKQLHWELIKGTLTFDLTKQKLHLCQLVASFTQTFDLVGTLSHT